MLRYRGSAESDTCNRDVLDLTLQDPSTITMLAKYMAY